MTTVISALQITSAHGFCKEEELVHDADQEPNYSSKTDVQRTPYELYKFGLSMIAEKDYQNAKTVFESCSESCLHAKYQLAVMLYDGLAGAPDCTKAVSLMKLVAQRASKENLKKLEACAYYNLGRAYYEGFGVSQSDENAEGCWLKAAMLGTGNGCVKAQSVLGMFYSRLGERNFDIKKSHFWHQEAVGSGSLESHAALGVMYEHGLGVPRSLDTAFRCFKSAAERGNIFAMGNLAVHYYKGKLFVSAADVSKRVGTLDDTEQLARRTDCLESFIKKGIALGCFVYGRLMHHGLAVEKDEREARKWYARAATFDLDVVAHMQNLMTLGYI